MAAFRTSAKWIPPNSERSTPAMPTLMQNSRTQNLDLNTASSLLDFKWSGATQTSLKSSANELQAYLLHVRDLKYGHEMSDAEEQLERTTWLNREAMHFHWDDFEKLTGGANSFVLSLIGSRFLEVLGKRAGLEHASAAARPSPEIPFAPVALPDPSPLDVSRYEELCGGPHVFGARLLWWCAAAQKPETFGYSQAFTNQLASQPFWFRVNDDLKIVLQTRPMQVMKRSLKRILESELEIASQVENKKPDGPLEGYRFQLDGREIELTKSNCQALTILWKKRQHRMRKPAFVAEIWNKVTSDGTVSSLVSRLNKQLANQKLCHWTVRIKGDLIELVNESPK